MVLLVAGACRTRTPENLSSHDVGTVTPPKGDVSVKLVPDPVAPEVQLAPDEEFVRPQLDRTKAMPVYPPELVPLHLATHTVVLRVYFDKSGHPIDVRQSPIGSSTDDQYRDAFEAAARKAMLHWRSYPAMIRKFRPGPDADGDGKPDYRIMVASRAFPTFFDVSFSFEIVNGQPVVRTSA